MQDYPVGYSKELFGKNYEHIDVISYAASFGSISYPKDFDKNIINWLNSFNFYFVNNCN